MKKIVLSLAVVAAVALMGTSCKNAKMQCWEYNYSTEGYTGLGYSWATQDQMDANAASYKLEKVNYTYKKASKYKTAEDCIDAQKQLSK